MAKFISSRKKIPSTTSSAYRNFTSRLPFNEPLDLYNMRFQLSATASKHCLLRYGSNCLKIGSYYLHTERMNGSISNFQIKHFCDTHGCIIIHGETDSLYTVIHAWVDLVVSLALSAIHLKSHLEDSSKQSVVTFEWRLSIVWRRETLEAVTRHVCTRATHEISPFIATSVMVLLRYKD